MAWLNKNSEVPECKKEALRDRCGVYPLTIKHLTNHYNLISSFAQTLENTFCVREFLYPKKGVRRMDDLVKRALLAFAFVIGMMLFIYFMIATGPDKPALLTLVYYNFMNRVFAAIWWFLQMIVLVAGITVVAFIIFQFWRAKQNEVAEKELKLRQDLIREEERRIRQKEKEMQQLEMKRADELEKFETQQRLIEQDSYFKNRSAEEANKDALKHFL